MSILNSNNFQIVGVILKLKFRFLLLSCWFIIPALLSAQICNTNIPLSTPDSRFSINTDGTVVDKKTGLMWMRCSLGQTWDGSRCGGVSTNFSWVEALNAGENHSFANHDDWRVPNIKELGSILEDACYEPAINETIFPSTPQTFFWTSSPHAIDTTDQRWLDFVVGDIYPPSQISMLALRLVR